MYSLLETSSFPLNFEVDSLHSQKYSSDKCNSEFRYKDGGYALKECKQWKSIVRNFLTVNDIQKLSSASRSILKK